MPDGSGSSFVVVGAGVADATAALTLQAEGHTGRVTLIAADDEAPYRGPHRDQSRGRP
jgi:glycine/D-amino acid oxidase-like deaminating enzyme